MARVPSVRLVSLIRRTPEGHEWWQTDRGFAVKKEAGHSSRGWLSWLIHRIVTAIKAHMK